MIQLNESGNLSPVTFKEILSETYLIQEAKNGSEAVGILQSYKHSVDLILLDVLAPQTDGYTFLEQLKGNMDYAAIPVIVMAQEGGEEEQIKTLSYGAADFYFNDLAEFLQQMVEKYEITPNELHLEITETAYMEKSSRIEEMVTKLKEMGFSIELDDFGSGYSSLNTLSRMMFDVLKLDVNFVQTETAKPVNEGIMKFVVDLAHWRNLSVVAEGVENDKQLQLLKEAGCDYAQGFYFSRPIPAEEFEKLLKTG